MGPRVARGAVRCWRCGELIGHTEPSDLEHDDHDRIIYQGHEHAGGCRRAAGRKAARR